MKEQKTDATTVSPYDEKCDVYLSAGFQGYDYYPFNSGEGGPEVIFNGKRDGNKITVYAGSCKYGVFDAIAFSMVINEGEDAGNGYLLTGTSIADMTKYVVGPTPEGVWYCAEVTDAFGDKYTDWTMTISKQGAVYSIDGFDIGLDAFAASLGLPLVPPTAVWDSESMTLTVPSETETGLGTQTESLVWIGVSGTDILFKFDFDKNTCTSQTQWGSYLNGDGWYSGYMPGVAFTKLTANAALKSNAAGNKVGKHFEGVKADFRYPQIKIGASVSKEQKSIKADNVKKSFRTLK